jgi:hypothetical protein
VGVPRRSAAVATAVRAPARRAHGVDNAQAGVSSECEGRCQVARTAPGMSGARLQRQLNGGRWRTVGRRRGWCGGRINAASFYNA